MRLATDVTDIRSGMNTPALQVPPDLGRESRAGNQYVFDGRRGDLVNILWHDDLGISLNAKRLERGRLSWPSTAGSALSTGVTQFGYLPGGIE